jgi:hypothetical protein
MLRRSLTILFALTAVAGCKRQAATPPAPVAAAPNPAEVRSVGKGATEAGFELHVPLVYVDGEPRGVLAYNELPASLAFDKEHRARLCDYLHLLGAECAKVQRIDFHVGTDTVFVAGDDLRKQRRVTFHFAGGLDGRPRLDSTLAPGELADVVVWVAEQPGMLKDDGRRGVRVNVDGRLVAKIKRNLLEGNVEPVVEPKAGEVARYRLADFLASRSVTVARVRGIDLVTRDERVVRLSADEVAKGVEFMAPDKGHGEMTFLVAGRSLKALAVDVWASSPPPSRPMRAAGELHASLGARP